MDHESLNSLQNLSISKKNILNIAFVGHVDSGKSTICGRILVDLNLVDERTIEKYKQQSISNNRGSWYLSWVMDLNPEERDKGITTELGCASFDLPNTRVNILDTPGHKQFVNEMIAGASRADVGVLIVSARNGEFEAGFSGGQTREHLLLLKAGNIETVIVLINKMDEVQWDQGRFGDIKNKILKYTKNLFRDMVFIPISGYHGDNIKTRRPLEYYDGMSFLEYLDSIKVNGKSKGPSMLILEKVKSSGNTFYYAKVEGGEFHNKGDYKIVPLNKNDKISITSEDDIEQEKSTLGETYKVKFKDHNEDITVGSRVVMKGSEEYSVASEFYSQVSIFEVKNAITPGYSCIMHINLRAVGCKITEMYSTDKKKIKVARKGDKIVALIKLEEPIIVSCTKDIKERFSLRDESLTVAAGMIKKIKEM